MTCRQDVANAIVTVCGTGEDEITDEATFESLGVDSLDLLEIAMIIEEDYPIAVQGEEFDGVTTFGGAVAVFDRLIAEQAT